MTVLRRFAGAALMLCVGCIVVTRPSCASVDTLADVLRAQGLTAGIQTLTNLEKPIASYAVSHDTRELLIAYYVDDGSGAIKEPLFVDRFDAAAHVWTSGKITGDDPKVKDSWCFGSVVGIHSSTNAYYVGTHLTPSAGCTFVLSRDLAVQAVLYGWDLAVFDNGTIVYQRSRVHFAPDPRYRSLVVQPDERPGRPNLSHETLSTHPGGAHPSGPPSLQR